MDPYHHMLRLHMSKSMSRARKIKLTCQKKKLHYTKVARRGYLSLAPPHINILSTHTQRTDRRHSVAAGAEPQKLP